MSIPWIGYYHFKGEAIFAGFDQYRTWYKDLDGPVKYASSSKVGIFFPRSLLVKKNMELIRLLIIGLEKRGIFPVPVFTQRREYGGPDCPGPEAGLALLRGVDLIINCESSFLLPVPKGAEAPSTILEELGVPVIQTVHSSGKTREEWEKDPRGMDPAGQIYWIDQPEFSGTIEPVLISARGMGGEDPYGPRRPIPERISFLLDRVDAWLKLGRLPVQERRVTLLLHKNPCSGGEASVAGGAGLDTLESVARIMQQMKDEGYLVSNCPENGRELVDMIMERKAVCEFRWTTVDEIVKKGGAIALIGPEKYEQWLEQLPQGARQRMTVS